MAAIGALVVFASSLDLNIRFMVSLQATWIRNTILHALRESTKINTRAVTSMFVYQNPSISALARFVVGLTSSSDAEPEGNKVEEMLNLVARYGQEFSQHKGHTVPPEGHVVLITGSTGAIGSNVLAELLQCTQVSKVFALNRPGATTLVDRQREALTSRGYSADLLNSQKLVLAEADLVQPNLGLTENLVEQVRTSSRVLCVSPYLHPDPKHFNSYHPHRYSSTCYLLQPDLTYFF